MDFRDRVFLAVAESLSFSKGAQELFISQPAVTRHIKEMESALGLSLFTRQGNRVFLTKAGELTYTHLKKIAQLYNDLEFAIGAIKDEHRGILRIGASSTISQYIIPEVLAAFHKNYPLIELNLLNGNSIQMEEKLLSNDIDLAFVENQSSNSSLKYIPFLDDEIVAIVGAQSPLAKKEVLQLSELSQIPIVLRERGSGTLEVIEKTLQTSHIDFENLQILIHLGSTESIKSFLTNFNGIALVSKRSISKELQIKTIKKLEIQNLRINRQFRIAMHPVSNLQIPNQFVRFILNYNF